MAGLYLPNTDMPTSCYECPIRNQGYSGDGMQCGKTKEIISWHDGQLQRENHCPIIQVYDHGRLIDADVLKDAMRPDCPAAQCAETWGNIYTNEKYLINQASTIIPADGGAE